MSDDANDEPYLLVEEVAERLGLPLSVLLRRVEAGDVPSRQVERVDGMHYALRLSDLGIETEAEEGEDATEDAAVPLAADEEDDEEPEGISVFDDAGGAHVERAIASSFDNGEPSRPEPEAAEEHVVVTPAWSTRPIEPRPAPVWITSEPHQPVAGEEAKEAVAEPAAEQPAAHEAHVVVDDEPWIAATHDPPPGPEHGATEAESWAPAPETAPAEAEPWAPAWDSAPVEAEPWAPARDTVPAEEPWTAVPAPSPSEAEADTAPAEQPWVPAPFPREAAPAAAAEPEPPTVEAPPLVAAEPPRAPAASLIDPLGGPRTDLASMSLDARDLVAGLLDRWERTLEQRIYTEQRQRFQVELSARQNMVKQLQMELQTARAEHAAAQAEKDRLLAAKERELAERERDLAETRRLAVEPERFGSSPPERRRRWFRARGDD